MQRNIYTDTDTIVQIAHYFSVYVYKTKWHDTQENSNLHTTLI
jgi:hypothetical protein